MSDPDASVDADRGLDDAATRRRGRRMIVLLGGIAVLAALGMLFGRILQVPARGDVTVSSVIAVHDGAGRWRMVAVWTVATQGGCVVLPWKVERSNRGFEVRSQLLAPADTAFPSICQGTGTAVLETVMDDPSGTTLAVNGTSFVVTHGDLPADTIDAP